MMNISLAEMDIMESGISSSHKQLLFMARKWIPTNWSNAQIKDFTGNSTYVTTQGDKG
jgi:hypothetical protein